MNPAIEAGFRNTWAVENMSLQVQGPAHENDKARRGEGVGSGNSSPRWWGRGRGRWPQVSLCSSRLMGREHTIILVLLFIISF